MKKTVSLFLSLLFLLFTFVSCGDETPTVEYKDDVPVINLCKNTLAAITLENSKAELTEISSTVLDIDFGDVKEQNLCDQFTVFHTAGVSFDEIGIFHIAEAGNPETVTAILKTYVKGKAEDQLYRSYFREKNTSWIKQRCAPSETMRCLPSFRTKTVLLSLQKSSGC